MNQPKLWMIQLVHAKLDPRRWLGNIYFFTTFSWEDWFYVSSPNEYLRKKWNLLLTLPYQPKLTCNKMLQIFVWLGNIIGWYKFVFIFLKFFGGHKSFHGATDTSVLDFWWCLLCILKPEWAALFTVGRGVQSPRFTSGVTLLTSWYTAWQLVTVPHMCVSAEAGCWIQIGDLPHSSLTRLTTRPPVTGSGQYKLTSARRN